ncbi:hypothetical protein DYB32_007850 [Aphanomyces invadans]|nr:hypothetical protein DYB32_007850 [Aphanomyces invadans]
MHRQASCSTFFLGDENQTTIDVTWMGESLGLELQRIRTSKLPSVDVLWKENMASVGVTFGIEQVTRQVVVKRTSRHDIVPGYILSSANGHRVMEHNFDATMRELKIGHDSGRSQLLQFVPPPAAPLVKSVDPRGVLGRAGLTHAYELKSVNGHQTRYQSLDQISIALRDAVKPCVLHFALSDDAQELMQLQETVATARNQSGATLAAAAIIAAVCI